VNRDIAKSVATNTTVLMGSQLVTWVSGFVLMLFLPRYLGSEDYGRLYLAISITTIAQLVVNFGGYYMITKEVSRSRENAPHLIVDSIGIRIVLWAVSTAALVAFSYLVGYSSESKVVIIILGVSMLWVGAGGVLVSAFRGFEVMRYPSLAAVVERIFVTVVGVGALLMGANSLVIAVVMAISTLLNFLVCLSFTPRIVSHIPKFNWNASVELLKISVPYFFSSFFTMLYFRVDAVLMSLMVPAAVVGAYGAAYRLFDTLMFLPFIFSTAVFPVLSRLWIKEENGLVQTTQKSLELITLAAIPVSVSLFAFSQEIVRLFFGLREYSSSVTVLQIFSVTLILVYIDFILVNTVLASDKQRRWSIVALIAVPLNVLLNFLLIPYTQTHYGNGGLGAAITTFITESFIMINAVVLVPKGILRVSRIGVPLKGVVAGIVMLGSVLLMRNWAFPWIAQAVVAITVYYAMLLPLKVLNSTELSFIRAFFTFRNLMSTFAPSREAKL
jgi:O-antigen/teichoic acid export membrane protein